MRFLDSYRFLPSSLECLAKSLTAEKFKNIELHFPIHEQKNLLIRKGIYPYSWFDDFNKFEEPSLPPKAAFFNELRNENVSDEDYEHARNVWNVFNMRNMGEYSDLYLKTDVLILADIFEEFRKLSLERFGLEVCHYYTIAGFAWDAMLRMTGITLDLLTDIEMIDFINKGIRGGVVQLNIKEAIANNKDLNDFDPNSPSIFIEYYDANNLYGLAMSQCLPYSSFEFVDEANLQTEYENAKAAQDDDDVGYILEVDIETPENLHDLYSDYPFCPENKKPPGGKFPKLILDFEKKKKYVLCKIL